MKNVLSHEIDERKVKANLFVLKNGSGSFELAEKFASFNEDDKNLIKFSTKSIKEIDPIGRIPLGFTLGFAATYPDVLMWWNNLSDEKQESIFKEFDEKDFLDINKQINLKYLKIIVEKYLSDAGIKLECSV